MKIFAQHFTQIGVMPLLFVAFCFQVNLDPSCVQNCHTSSTELSK